MANKINDMTAGAATSAQQATGGECPEGVPAARCPKCDRPRRTGGCELNQELEPGIFTSTFEAMDDCRDHAVDWRQRALDATARIAECEAVNARLIDAMRPHAALDLLNEAIKVLVMSAKDSPAKNYVSFRAQWDDGIFEQFGNLPFQSAEVVLLRPGGKTTHELKADAEAERDRLKEAIRELSGYTEHAIGCPIWMAENPNAHGDPGPTAGKPCDCGLAELLALGAETGKEGGR